MALIRNMFAGIGCLTVAVVLALAAWFYRDEIVEWIDSRHQIVMSEPSPELAMRAEEKIQDLLDGKGDRETRFSEVELQSYVQYRLVDRLPPGVYEPALDLKDSTIAVSARLDLSRLRLEGAAAENLRRMIGDSALVTGEVYPSIASPGHGRVEVLSLQAGVFPVPPLLIGTGIQQLGLPTQGRAVLFDLPEGVTGFRVENEEVVLIRDR